ncbi:diguanylate cyclase (GGDEF)-like protein/PAS domain S-box-containing protein [Chitinivorax tropicus]|uniref:diguanylate cyclase n=1 Tax=Chitinivorax tropicus TaxID=714531 RepID=A0A840MNG1_9PROT|nr:diguanylate cyclase [Chitinivorax tropicus]MBB5019005.1 diguanylate cyclase (GGDEF)-like protein/PAS domain S-box-containing protein [Chitinivorax tropicus]
MSRRTGNTAARLKQQRWLVVAIAVTLVLAIVSWLSFLIHDARVKALDAANIQVENLSTILKLRVSGLLREADLVLLDIADETHDLSPDLVPAHQQNLRTKLASLPQAGELAIFNSQGELVTALHSNASRWAGLDVSSWLSELRGTRHATSRTDTRNVFNTLGPSVFLLQQLHDRQGHMIGAVCVVLPVSRLLVLLESLDIGTKGVVSLHDEQGTWLARTPTFPAPGVSLPPHGEVRRLATSQSTTQRLLVKSSIDGVERLTSFRRVPNSALILAVGLSTDEILQTLQNSLWIYATASVAVILLVSVMVVLFWRAQNQTLALLQHRKLLEASEERFRLTAEVAPVSLVIAAYPSLQVEFINQRAALLFNIDTAAATGRHVQEFFVAQHDADTLSQLLNNQEQINEFEMQLKRRDGSLFWALVSVRAGQAELDQRLYICLVDITERKELEIQLERQAITDSLTSLVNRRGFVAKAVMEISRSRRFHRPMSLMLLDIDHFKQVNDRYGHAVGDQALQAMARACQQVVRQSDVIGRLGGEEFAVLLPETDILLAEEVAERIRLEVAALRIPVSGENPLWFTVSIGVTLLHLNHQTIEDVMAEADIALYQAKSAGRNRVVRYRPANTSASHK